MRTKQHSGAFARKRHQPEKAGRFPRQTAPDAQERMTPTGDAGGGISEGSLRDASGVETGGGTDTPQHVEESTEAAENVQQPLHQGTSAYTGGGADNGSNL